jgi:hypothetical protein
MIEIVAAVNQVSHETRWVKRTRIKVFQKIKVKAQKMPLKTTKDGEKNEGATSDCVVSNCCCCCLSGVRAPAL